MPEPPASENPSPSNPLQLSSEAEQAYLEAVSFSQEKEGPNYKRMDESKRFGLFVRPGEVPVRKSNSPSGAPPQGTPEEEAFVETDAIRSRAEAAADSTLKALEEEEELSRRQEEDLARLSAEIDEVEKVLKTQTPEAPDAEEPAFPEASEPGESPELRMNPEEEESEAELPSGARRLSEVPAESLDELMPLDEPEPRGRTLEEVERELAEQPVKSGLSFMEKTAIFLMLGTLVAASILVVGGYLQVLDRSVVFQLIRGQVHQFEFVAPPESRQVRNAYNRLPLVVVEGKVRNLFGDADQVGKVRLKALALDADGKLLETRIVFAGSVLTDEELEGWSPVQMQQVQETPEGRSGENQGLASGAEIPFQAIFFEAGNDLGETLIQLISYERQGETVYVRVPESAL